MIGFSRGGALIETALAIGIVLTLLLGTVQLGIVGFKQIAQDGAVFVAAHTYAQSPALGVPRATTAASSVFDTIAATSIAVAPATGAVTATASSTASAPSVPGAPAAIGLRSGATERIASGGTPGAFSATSTLSNYRDASGTPVTTRPLVVAQPGLPSGNCDQTGGDLGCDGNHVYVGHLSEWDCRLAAYRALWFPSSRPRGYGTGPGSAWDPASSSSQLYSIYRWDGGTGCW